MYVFFIVLARTSSSTRNQHDRETGRSGAGGCRQCDGAFAMAAVMVVVMMVVMVIVMGFIGHMFWLCNRIQTWW